MSIERASKNRVICRGREIPAGWVVVGVYHNPACDSEGDNALIVKQPGKTDVIWCESPVPAGYAKIRATHSESCPGEGENALVIERKKG